MEIDNLDIKKEFYKSLNERQKRHFLGIQAIKLGYGGITAVSKSFEVDRDTISRGRQEVLSGDRLPDGRIRQEGGGRKKNSLRNQN